MKGSLKCFWVNIWIWIPALATDVPLWWKGRGYWKSVHIRASLPLHGQSSSAQGEQHTFSSCLFLHWLLHRHKLARHQQVLVQSHRYVCIEIEQSFVVFNIFSVYETQDIMGKLYDFNHQPEHWEKWDYQPGCRQHKTEDLHQWGGPMVQCLAQAIYTIAFLCLLWIDEALKIQIEHISLDDEKITLTLSFRKTHQFGSNQLFSRPLIPRLISGEFNRDQAFCDTCPTWWRGTSLPSSSNQRMDPCKSDYIRIPVPLHGFRGPTFSWKYTYGPYDIF